MMNDKNKDISNLQKRLSVQSDILENKLRSLKNSPIILQVEKLEKLKKAKEELEKPIIIEDNFVVLKQLGKGSFGRIHIGYNKRDNEVVAVKKEMKSKVKPTLKTEFNVLKTLLEFHHENSQNNDLSKDFSGLNSISQKSINGVPKFYGYGEYPDFFYLIIELLGPNLTDLLNYCKGQLSILTVCMIALQMISRIENIHSHNYLHRDIKPENFVLGCEQKSNTVFLIDYGLCKKYKDGKTLQHIPYRENREPTGTIRYYSIFTHMGIEQSRRDDLESIGYVLVFLVKGGLPWQGIKSINDKNTKIMEKKLQIPTELLCRGIPDEFAHFINYSKNLKFEDRPDYSYLKGLFVKLMNSCINLYSLTKDNLKFDWCFENPKYIANIMSKKNQRILKMNSKISNSSINFKRNKMSKITEKIEDTKLSIMNNDFKFGTKKNTKDFKKSIIADLYSDESDSLSVKSYVTEKFDENNFDPEEFKEVVVESQNEKNFDMTFIDKKQKRKSVTIKSKNYENKDSHPNHSLLRELDSGEEKKSTAYLRPALKGLNTAKNDFSFKTNFSKESETLSIEKKIKAFQSTIKKENSIKISHQPLEIYYIQLESIGEGGFGQVKKVYSKIYQEERAMKIINKKESFKFMEINILTRISHPNIIKFFEVFEDNRNYYIITELIMKGDLYNQIYKRSSFNEYDTCRIIYQILSAINYLHEFNIIHRDLKPENILIYDLNTLEVKIIDFGLSVILEKDDYLTNLAGSLYYISPEVIKGHYNEKCDIWSTGIIMFFLLFGYPPFSGKNEEELKSNILNKSIDINLEEFNYISNEAKEILRLMLTKDFQFRPSAKELLRMEWFKSLNENKLNERIIPKDVVERLSNFQNQNYLKKAITHFITKQIKIRDDEDELLKIFKKFDKDNNGVLNKEEIFACLEDFFGKNVGKVIFRDIFSKMDIDNSGDISYDEFVAAFINQSMMLTYENLEKTFNAFDKDGNGKISLSEIEELFGENKEKFEKIFNHFDINKDGEIDFQEFRKMMNENFYKI